MSLDFNPDGKKTILSIDGGGMRGVLPVLLLIALEEQTNKPAYELFDMVAGTSTGAIIAAGLGLGYSAQEILDLVYRTRLPAAFQNTGGCAFWFRWLIQNRFRHQYSLEPFRQSLDDFTGDKRVRDLDKCIVLFTVKDVRTSNTYYVVNEGPGAAMFGDWPVSGAVAASGAAPIYFPPVVGDLIDGGVGVYGNPCLAAAVEAVDYIGFDPANTLHYSLGTGYVDNSVAPGRAARYNAIDWLRYVAGEGIDDAGLQQSLATRAIYSDGRGMDFRRYNPLLEQTTVENTLGVDTSGIKVRSLGLDTVAPEAIALMERIGRAYAERIDFTLANQMPWDTVGGRQKPTIAAVDWSGSPYAV